MESETPMESAVKQLLISIGEDPEREGLLKTPKRVEKALRFLTKGYAEDPAAVINGAIFHVDQKDMVIVKDIDFFSMCEHHMLPFYGRCHIGYIPDKRIVGISKLARITEIFARRLQVQERLNDEIANCLNIHLKPKGVAVVMEANHLCMMMRGVEKQRSSTITSTMIGAFKENSATRSEFMSLINSR